VLATPGFNDPWDPTNLSVYGQDLVTVTQSSPGQFQGTVDITKVPLPSMAGSSSGSPPRPRCRVSTVDRRARPRGPVGAPTNSTTRVTMKSRSSMASP
jgi:hypothetical protein